MPIRCRSGHFGFLIGVKWSCAYPLSTIYHKVWTEPDQQNKATAKHVLLKSGQWFMRNILHKPMADKEEETMKSPNKVCGTSIMLYYWIMTIPSVQLTPVTPALHIQSPVCGSHVWLVVQEQVWLHLYPNHPSAHSGKGKFVYIIEQLSISMSMTALMLRH